MESSCLRLYELFTTSNGGNVTISSNLRREKTISFLLKGLKHLSEGFQCLDASRPWLVYWIIHSLELLNVSIQGQQKSDIINFLAKCQCPSGGFAGGPGQVPHLAPTYAAVNALVILGGEEAYQVINREKLAQWMNKLRQDDGSFVMHEGGEVDIRGKSQMNILGIQFSNHFILLFHFRCLLCTISSPLIKYLQSRTL